MEHSILNRTQRIQAALPLMLISLSIFILLVVRPSIMQGMNMDGVVYVNLALNMANGIGTLWDPSLMPHFFHHFREHPPLGIYFESLVFKLLGEGVYTEKLYCFALVCALFFSIYQIWKKTQPADVNPYLSFCFIYLLWTVCPMSGWVGLGNYLEVPLAVCTTFASLFIITALRTNKKYYLLCMGGLLIAAAFFTNGPVGFFPLAIPFIYWLVFREHSLRDCIVQSFLVLIFALGCIAAVLTYEPARLNTMEYINSQVVASISGARDPVNTGFWRLMGLVYIATQFYIALSLSITLIVLISRSNKKTVLQIVGNKFNDKWTCFFLLLGLAASLPILVSTRQTSHYFYPSLPFYLLMFSHILLPHFHSGYAKLRLRSKSYTSLLFSGSIMLIFAMIFTVQSSGRVLNDHDKHIHDLAAINTAIPLGDSITLDSNSDSAFIFNFYRYFRRMTLTQANATYYLQDRSVESRPKEYEEVQAGLKYYRLFKKL